MGLGFGFCSVCWSVSGFFFVFPARFWRFFWGGVLGLGLGFLVGFSGVFGGFRVYWWVLG